MRLTLKITLVTFLGVFLVLAGYSYATLRRQLAQFDRDVRAHHQALGTALASAVATAWRLGGEHEARTVLASADAPGDQVRIRWVSLSGMPGEAEPPFPLPFDALVALSSGKTVTVRPPSDAPEARLFTYVSVPLASPLTGAVEISESIAEHQQFARDTFWQAAAATALIALICAGVILAIGSWLVARPTRALVSMSDRIARGDLSGRIDIRQRDELGRLGNSMNAMAAQLSDSRVRLAEETLSRLRAVEQLRHADRLSTVGKLAAGVAHELGTPLNVIAGHAGMLATGEVEGEEARDAARVIQQQTRTLTGVIRELLAFARRRVPEKTQVNISELINRTLGILRPLAVKREVELKAVPFEPLSTNVDEGQIGQALTNLVVNGIQAMSSGGELRVELDRAREEPPPELGGEAADFVRIHIVDEGEGIPEEVLPHVFEPFFTTKGVGEGTGLGLSVSYGLVSEHGGWISVESTPHVGSRFTLHLPLVEAAPEEVGLPHQEGG